MGPEGIILVNPPVTTFQQSFTHSAIQDTAKRNQMVLRGAVLEFFFKSNIGDKWVEKLQKVAAAHSISRTQKM